MLAEDCDDPKYKKLVTVSFDPDLSAAALVRELGRDTPFLFKSGPGQDEQHSSARGRKEG